MSPGTSVAAIILAAGGSERMGRPKPFLPVDREGKVSLLVHVVEQVLAVPFAQVVVVLGHRAREAAALLKGQPVQVVVNRAWREGLSTSLRCGLGALRPEVEGALFILGDQVGLTAALLWRLVEAFEATGGPLVAPEQGGRLGNPVLFHRAFFPALEIQAGDQGGRSLVRQHRDQVVPVPVEDPWELWDLDTPEDYARWLAHLAEGNTPPYGGREETSMSRTSHVLHEVQGFLLDLDGVFYWDTEPLPGGREFIALLRESGTPFRFLTNNSTRTPAQYQAKLARFGIQVEPESVITSSLATASYLEETLPPGSKLFVIGQDGLLEALQARGFLLTREDLDVAAVVVGMDTRLTFDHLRRATLAVRAGARFVATNPDRTFPSDEGIIPGNGAIVAALEAATEQQAFVIGKPEAPIFQHALRQLGLPAGQVAMVGDRLETDILGAQRCGLRSVLVLCGLTSPEAVASSPFQPDLVCADLAELTALWAEELARRRVAFGGT
ncbi:MAG: HAD-IIA family hydrolase [Anaerolineae bacterium]